MKNKDSIQGLTDIEVKQQMDKGLINHANTSITKSKKQIFKENICTLFNLLNFLIAIALLLVQAYSNLFFIVIIICNICIGILQELHAKKLIDDLSLLIKQKALVMRNGKQQRVESDHLVLGDVMVLSSGEQILCDAVILQGEVEANEALLTGESDPIHKKQDDLLLSGSSIISGKCYAKIIHINEDNYANKITDAVKEVRVVNSNLLKSIRKVTRFTSILIIPLGIILFLQAYYLRDASLQESVIASSAGLLGMLPKGLVLLISVSLATGVTRLAKKNILVQDLYSLETLANVDVLCLDKTGTITTGDLQVDDVIPLASHKDEYMEYIKSYLYYSDDNNATYQALCNHVGTSDIHEPTHRIPFSSVRKWSSAYFDDFGTVVMGAPDKLIKQQTSQFNELMEDGKRIIIIGYTDKQVSMNEPLPEIKPWYAFVLCDTIRPHVEESLEYFRKEGVEIKIISGDHITSVSNIARLAGLKRWNACIDMSTIGENVESIEQIAEQYSVFGRVTPLQKKLLVTALQKKGHSVAMSGDGVNDMLALKEADCSIAIAEGSEAVKQMSQIVLLDSDFSALPRILKEGRRVINNTTRVAGVFFIKTMYSIMLSILCLALNLPFPFIPIQVTLIDLVIEAFPSFFTMLEPDYHKVEKNFLSTVLWRALPNAITIVCSFLAIQYLSSQCNISQDVASTMLYLCVTVISLFAVYRSFRPFTTLRYIISILMTGGIIVAIVLFRELLHLVFIPSELWLISLIIFISVILLQQLLVILLPYFRRDNKS